MGDIREFKMVQKAQASSVSPEEVERRILECRQLALDSRAEPVVVYHPEHQSCPWQGCDYRINGIQFQLDRMGNAAQQDRWRAEFWGGSGVTARCPGCGRFVCFGLQNKQAVPDSGPSPLPDDWYVQAHVAPARKT